MIKKSKKGRYIIVFLIVISLIVVGTIFFFWNKSKSQNTPDSSSSIEDNLPPNEDISVYSTYVPQFSPNISEEEAKKEVIKTIWEWGGKEPTKQEVEKILLKNNSEMDYQEDKKLEKENPTFKDEVKYEEKISQKYQKDIFFSPPSSQAKFEKGIIKTERIRNFYQSYNGYLERKTNSEIDWITTLKKCSKRNNYYEKIPKKRAEEDYKKVTDYIEKEVNPFLLKHGKKFEKITNLAELNQWANIEARKRSIASSYLLHLRWRLGKKIGKKSSHSLDIPTGSWIAKNKKFDLSYRVTIYMIRDL